MFDNDSLWFTETHHDQGSAFSIKVFARLHDEQTEYQRIEIYETNGSAT